MFKTIKAISEKAKYIAEVINWAADALNNFPVPKESESRSNNISDDTAKSTKQVKVPEINTVSDSGFQDGNS